jgi:DNA-binding GntR family transcriptional regulator
MDHDEMREILEEIARQKANPNAAVAAIRALRQLAKAEAEEEEDGDTPFDDLDAAAKFAEWRKRHGSDE